MLSKILSGVALLALVAAVAVVATGQKDSFEAVVGTGAGSGEARDKAFSDSPIGRSQLAAARENVSAIAMEAQLSFMDGTVRNQAELITHLREKLPETLTTNGQPTRITQRKSTLFFCSKPNYYAICASFDTVSGENKTGVEKPNFRQARASVS